MNIEKLNGKYIGYKCTPSRWTHEPKYQKITVISMTCGGGTGSSSWKEYVYRTGIGEGIANYVTIDGKEINLNSNYIVKTEDFTLVTVRMETCNSNYYPENNCLGKTLDYVKWVPITMKFLINDGETVELIDDYSDAAKKKNRIWRVEQNGIQC